MALGVIGGAVAIGSTLYGGVKGAIQEHKGNQLEKSLKDPIYNIPDEFYQNRNIARQMAQLGLPQQQYNNQANNIAQGQAAGIDAISRSANPGAGVAAIVRQSDNATNNLNAQDAAAKDANERFYIQTNKDLANQELAKQQSDVFDKYTRQFNQAQALKGAGAQNVNSAINGIGQIGELGVQYATANKPVLGTTDLQPVAGTPSRLPYPYIQPGSFGYQEDPNINRFNYGVPWGYSGIFK